MTTPEVRDRSTSMSRAEGGEDGAARELHLYWDAFCDADPFPDPEGDFADRMAAAGLIELVEVSDEDLDDPFAAERGIYPGGLVWHPTRAGLAALRRQHTEEKTS